MNADQIIQIESLKFEGVTFGYEGEDKLFKMADFDFPMNQTIWVKALSGAGRSTLLQLLAVLLFPEQGRLIINGKNIYDLSFEEFLPLRLNIGYGFDFGGLINNRTLLENVTLPLLYHKILSNDQAQDRAIRYFEKLGIARYKDMRPAIVPGGVRKVTCLIRSLILHPQLLLLDDPSVGLGAETLKSFMSLIQEIQNEGFLKHLYIASYDENMMQMLDHQEIYIDQGLIHYQARQEIKKAVSL